MCSGIRIQRKNRPEMKKRPQRASGTSNLVQRAGVQPFRRAIRALEQTPAAVAGIGGRCTRWLEKSMMDGCLLGFRSEAEDWMAALARVNRMTRIVGECLVKCPLCPKRDAAATGRPSRCHTLVMNEGTSSRLAAADGRIASVSSPRPIMPLTAPASRKPSTMIVVVSGCTRALRDDGEGAMVNRQPTARHLALPRAASGARDGRFGGSAAPRQPLREAPRPCSLSRCAICAAG